MLPNQTTPIITASGTYAPAGKYLWDNWFIKEADVWHMFHLQADASLHPLERHHHSEIGHATSTDLINWETQPIALQPGTTGEWDDLALWTGSVLKNDDTYYQFYTGRNERNYWGQTIGLATSQDLITWKKHPQNPIIKADAAYCLVDANIACNFNSTPAWRDPHVRFNEELQQYCMVICARTAAGINQYNGTIALATSTNLLDWELHVPLLTPNVFEEMETPQIVTHKGYNYLFFSVRADKYEPTWRSTTGDHNGLHCYVAPTIQGDYVPINKTGHVPALQDNIYATKILEHYKDDLFIAIGWVDGGYLEGNGTTTELLGRLSYPFLVELTPEKISTIGYL